MFLVFFYVVSSPGFTYSTEDMESPQSHPEHPKAISTSMLGVRPPAQSDELESQRLHYARYALLQRRSQMILLCGIAGGFPVNDSCNLGPADENDSKEVTVSEAGLCTRCKTI